MKYVLGIDIGGTKIALGIMDDSHNMLESSSFFVGGLDVKDIFSSLEGNIDSLLGNLGIERKDISAIGIGIPGIMSHDRKSVLFAPNIHLLNNFPLYDSLKELFPDAEIVLENDANTAALAENRMGAGDNRENMIFVTISTGIGAGFIINHKLFRGSHLAAGEIGHMITYPGGELCGCGNRGCAEAYAGGANYPKYIRHLIDSGRKTVMEDYLKEHGYIDGKALSQALEKEDPLALEVFDRICKAVGLLFYNLYKCLNIDCYVIGGGLTNIGKRLFDTIEKHFKELRMGTDTMDKVYFLPAKFSSNEIGIYGTALVALEELKEKDNE